MLESEIGWKRNIVGSNGKVTCLHGYSYPFSSTKHKIYFYISCVTRKNPTWVIYDCRERQWCNWIGDVRLQGAAVAEIRFPPVIYNTDICTPFCGCNSRPKMHSKCKWENWWYTTLMDYMILNHFSMYVEICFRVIYDSNILKMHVEHGGLLNPYLLHPRLLELVLDSYLLF